jgi:hypothetical protein
MPNTALMSFIERASRDDQFSLDKFRELIMMQREAEQASAKHEFNIAMSRVQSELQSVTRDRSNPATRSRYATMQAIDAEARPVYTRHGFSVRFGTGTAPWEGWVRVTCELAHVGGYSESHHLDGPLDNSGAQGKTNKTGIQAIGSTVSYLRRYLLLLVLNLVTTDEMDDDGEATRRTPASRRDEINAEIPIPGEPPPRPKGRTAREYLAELHQRMADAEDQAAVNAIIAEPGTQRAMATFQNGAKAELDGIIAYGIGRFGGEPATDWTDEEAPPSPPLEGEDKQVTLAIQRMQRDSRQLLEQTNALSGHQTWLRSLPQAEYDRYARALEARYAALAAAQREPVG